MSKHSPTPWRRGKGTGGLIVRSVDGNLICLVNQGSGIPAPGNADFLVQACNHHDELVATLERVLQAWESTPRIDQASAALADDQLCQQAHSLLARVRGG